MKEQLMVIASFPVSPVVIVVAGLLLAAIVAGFSFYLLRGNKKDAKASGGSGAASWQPQAPMQGGTGAGGWNPQGMGAQGDAWGQGQQAPGGWGAPTGTQQAPGGWGAPTGGQQAQGGWGTPGGTQQAQPANPWGAPAGGQQAQGGWGTLGGTQQAQPANPWGTPGGTQQAQPANPWENPAAQAGGWGGPAAQQQAWDATSAPVAQDPWAQQAQAQQGAGWGMPQQQQQQMPPTAYGAANQGQAWGQTPAPADAWGATPVPTPGTPAPASPWQQQGGFGGNAAAGAGANTVFADSDKTMLRSMDPQAGRGVVQVEEGKEPGRVYEVLKGSLSIGRSRDSDIFLEDLAVSRLHASIVNLGNGSYALKDEGSANGTKVNGQLVNKFQTYPLQEGDRIQLGQTVLVFARR